MKYVLPFALAMCVHATASAAAGNIEAGREAFTRLCASCHHVGPSARPASGPQLHGPFGRKAGSTADFRYSDAMKPSTVLWSDATFTAFVQSHGKVLPGSKCR